MNEKEFVLKFKEVCNKNEVIKVVHTEENSQSKHMDCELVYDKQYVRLEAKFLSDTRNNSQKVLKIFGGLMKGRRLPAAKSTKYPICYGILLSEDQLETALRIFKFISFNDWNLFGESFEVKYIFIFDYIRGKVDIKTWRDFNVSGF